MYGGAFLVIIGILFLFKDLGFLAGLDWGIIWPVLFILLGISMMNRRNCGCKHCTRMGWWGMNHHPNCVCEDCGKEAK